MFGCCGSRTKREERERDMPPPPPRQNPVSSSAQPLPRSSNTTNSGNSASISNDKNNNNDDDERFKQLELAMIQGDMEKYLKTVPLFETLNSTEITAVAQAFEIRQYRDGEYVYRQGDSGGEFYCVLEGLVQCRVGDPTRNEILMHTLKQGQLFGEMVLLSDNPRSASMVAKGNTTLAKLTTIKFERAIKAKIIEVLKRKPSLYARFEPHFSRTAF